MRGGAEREGWSGRGRARTSRAGRGRSGPANLGRIGRSLIWIFLPQLTWGDRSAGRSRVTSPSTRARTPHPRARTRARHPRQAPHPRVINSGFHADLARLPDLITAEPDQLARCHTSVWLRAT